MFGNVFRGLREKHDLYCDNLNPCLFSLHRHKSQAIGGGGGNYLTPICLPGDGPFNVSMFQCFKLQKVVLEGLGLSEIHRRSLELELETPPPLV